MRNLLIVFFVISLILLILVFPFKTRLMGHINLLEMKCYYSAKSWIVRLLSGMIFVKNGKVEMINNDTFLTGSYNNDFVKQLSKEILEKLNIKKIEIFFTGGFKENSFSSAIMCGSVLSLVETIYGYMSLKYDDVKMYKDISPTFEEDNLELTIDLVVSISLIKLVQCLFLAGKKYKKLKEIKNEG